MLAKQIKENMIDEQEQAPGSTRTNFYTQQYKPKKLVLSQMFLLFGMVLLRFARFLVLPS